MSQNKYHAYTTVALNQPVKYQEATFDGDLSAEMVQIKVSHCGVCYSDVALIDDEWKFVKAPIICGHEVVGVISAVGKDVDTVKVGDRVGCSNVRISCRTCEFCISGRDNLCNKALWTAMQGGFGEYVRLHHTNVWVLPASISSAHAAPLMCAGATVFAPFKVQEVKPTHRVGIVGIGGLGHVALQIAKAWGCEVTALSTNKDKETESKKFGAHHFVVTGDAETVKKSHKDYFDFIMVTTPQSVDWGLYLVLLKKGGVLCVAGLAGQSMNIPNLFDLVIKELRIVGAAGCSRTNYREMIEFCALHNIKPQIEIMPAEKINEALDRVRQGKPRYRVVLEHKQ